MSENKFIRGILPMEFAMSRSLELYNLIQRVKHTSSSKLPIQKLPCHLRRRSASHKPYKLPLRRVVGKTKYGANPNVGVGKRRKINSHIKHFYNKRKRRLYRMKYLSKSLLARSKYLKKSKFFKNTKSLPLTTHLFHAKRFRMAKYTNWIYSIALSCMFKTYRPSCRALLGYSILMDMSYLIQFQVISNHIELINWFKANTDCNIGNDIESKVCMEGLCEGETILCASSSTTSRQIIGPIKYSISVGKSETKLWIWSHPICAKPIDKLLSDSPKLTTYELMSVQHKFNRYRLIGPRSLEILFNTLLACCTSSNLADDKFLQSGKLWNKHENDGRTVYNLLVQLSLVKKPKKINKHHASTFKSINSQAYPSDMIDFHTRFKGIVEVDGQKYIPVSVVLSQPFDRLQDHIDIIVRDSGGGRRLWNALLNRDLCIGGLRELQTYHCNYHQPLFPYDYPDACNYHQSTFDYYASECMKLLKNQRLPPSKRINFTKLRQVEHESLLFCHRKWIEQWKITSLEYIENCFLSIPICLLSTSTVDDVNSSNTLRVCRNGFLLKALSNYFIGKIDSGSTLNLIEEQLTHYDLSSTLVFVSFNHVNHRGVPKALATIHLPTCQILQKSINNDCVDRDFRTFNCYVKNQFSIDMNWPFVIIGQCTSGGYSYRYGYPTAQGFISLKALIFMIELKLKPTPLANFSNHSHNGNNYRNTVLLRNRGSDRYIRSHFSIILPSYQL